VDVAARLEQLTWTGTETAVLGDVSFSLPDPHRAEDATSAVDSFALLKDRSIVEAYVEYWRDRPPFEANNVFELGLWDGGSIALWHEILQPQMHVGVDIADRRTPYFDEYAAGRGGRIHTYWDVDQGDKRRLTEIAANHFSGPLDLVLDDGSHLYGPTKASMEVLFPLLRPGGLYIVEDWAWGHWGAEFRLHASPERAALTRLVSELAGIVGSVQDVVAALDVRRHFIVVERGTGEVGDLSLAAINHWRGRHPRDSRVFWLARRYLGAARRRLSRRLR
jgi:SAM-dependent methyltransferase